MPMRKLLIKLMLPVALAVVLMRPSVTTKNKRVALNPGNQSYDISDANKSFGLVEVLHNSGTTSKIKLMVQRDNSKYVYNLGNLKAYIPFPTQLGDGNYSVTLYQNTTGTKYKKIYSKSTQVKLDNPHVVYLQAIQLIEWDETKDAIILAKDLVAKAKTKNKKNLTKRQVIDLLYNYVVTTMKYDYEKIEGLDYDYVPDIDAVLEAQSGICYDYSVLLAAMLRSQGIPTKLVKGYTTTTDVYHAWNEIYLEDEKRWAIIDTTYDAYMHSNRKKYNFEKALKDYKKSYEF